MTINTATLHSYFTYTNWLYTVIVHQFNPTFLTPSILAMSYLKPDSGTAACLERSHTANCTSVYCLYVWYGVA